MNARSSILLPAACVLATACTTRPTTSSGAATAAVHSSATKAEVRSLADQIREPLRRARYMEAADLSAAKVPGWQAYPTRKFSYALTDSDGTRRDAEVVMLNPTAEQLAHWIISASYTLKGRYDAAFCKKLFRHVISCSGGQFVVRGICLEDMDGDGIQRAYPFQDGVTVRLKLIDGFPERPLTAQEMAAALGSTPSDVTTFYKSARLQNSTPVQWAAFTRTSEVSGAEWLKTVRIEYQKAWNSRDNAMLTATAKALGF